MPPALSSSLVSFGYWGHLCLYISSMNFFPRSLKNDAKAETFSIFNSSYSGTKNINTQREYMFSNYAFNVGSDKAHWIYKW